ncbi:uncharacterized protein LOC62_02G002583 [Vanrija pseudolonga]|uniref:RNase III domain-containing protein n=1 Tax=Vanrija pseudolonga TaxID=143232 RepID=A0AAF1BG17_9TREE|nr:hypothetical protein LOC62_02G002583 [Vanrija pseudolonga]
MPMGLVEIPELDPWTLTRALTHRSGVKEHADSYEELEQIGDAVLELFAVLLIHGYSLLPPISKRAHRQTRD